MPVIKSAKKKLRKDKKRETRNSLLKVALRKALKNVVKKPGTQSAVAAIKLADKAAKNNIIHKNKANRIMLYFLKHYIIYITDKIIF